MKMKKWSSQWTQFMQLRKEAWKKKKKIQDSNGAWTRDLAIPVRCSTNWAMKRLMLGAGQLWVHMFPWKNFFSGFFTQLHKLRSLRRSFLHFHFISAVHIWFFTLLKTPRHVVHNRESNFSWRHSCVCTLINDRKRPNTRRVAFCTLN